MKNREVIFYLVLFLTFSSCEPPLALRSEIILSNTSGWYVPINAKDRISGKDLNFEKKRLLRFGQYENFSNANGHFMNFILTTMDLDSTNKKIYEYSVLNNNSNAGDCFRIIYLKLINYFTRKEYNMRIAMVKEGDKSQIPCVNAIHEASDIMPRAYNYKLDSVSIVYEHICNAQN